MAKILVLHGPNLNLLGQREPKIYGSVRLDEINKALLAQAHQAGHTLEYLQANSEDALINAIQQAYHVAFIIINPAALAHTSIALRDSLLATRVPFIEVHLSNIYQRESFRHHSYLADIAQGVICGLGAQGYDLALQAAIHQMES